MSGYSEAIEKDLAWREQELVALKRLAITNKENNVSYRSTLRAMWAMLYAHYEGFTKFCWDIYLDELDRREVQRAALSEALRVLSLEGFFKGVRKDLSSANLWMVFSGQLPDFLNEVADFPEKARPATESNLWPAVFRRETRRLGITCDLLDENEARLRSLVARRNEIAHGQKMTIDSIADYEPFEDAVLHLMHELGLLVIQHLDEGAFLDETPIGATP